MQRKIITITVLTLATAAAFSTPAMAAPLDHFPDTRATASAACQQGGQMLAKLTYDRQQKMTQAAAAQNFYALNRDFGRVGSHIPNSISRKVADALATLVYAYPKIPGATFADIGTFQCEVLRRIPPQHPNAGDVYPLLAINAEDCLQKWGDPLKPTAKPTGIPIYDNDKVAACVGRAAKAIAAELLKP